MQTIGSWAYGGLFVWEADPAQTDDSCRFKEGPIRGTGNGAETR